MGWEWMPETPEEIAEHQRMRKNLIECQQMYAKENEGPDSETTKEGSRSLLVTIAVIVVLIYFLFFR